MKKKGLLIIYIIILLFLLIDISDVFAKDIIYSGRVIDADTKEPIEGAVVVAVWYEARGTITGPDTRLKDVKETLTNKDGRWSIVGPEGDEDKLIPGLLQLFMIYITREPYFVVFKPGYCSWSFGAFGIDACKEKLKPSGKDGFIKGEIVELPKLTDRERMTIIRNIPSLGMASEAEKKLSLFQKLVEQEEKEIRR